MFHHEQTWLMKPLVIQSTSSSSYLGGQHSNAVTMFVPLATSPPFPRPEQLCLYSIHWDVTEEGWLVTGRGTLFTLITRELAQDLRSSGQEQGWSPKLTFLRMSQCHTWCQKRWIQTWEMLFESKKISRRKIYRGEHTARKWQRIGRGRERKTEGNEREQREWMTIAERTMLLLASIYSWLLSTQVLVLFRYPVYRWGS